MAQEKIISVTDDEGLFSSEEEQEEEQSQTDILQEISKGLKNKVKKMEDRIKKFEKNMEKTVSDIRKEVAADVIKQLGKGRVIFLPEDQEGE